jgi:hypothetical protein
VEGVGDWSRIAVHIGTGDNRSSVQVKSIVQSMHAKLKKYGIPLRKPEDVDALPDLFFANKVAASKMMAIRNTFADTWAHALEGQSANEWSTIDELE